MNTLPYLCTAYTIIAVVLALYTGRLAWRLRASRLRLQEQDQQPDQESGR